MPQFHTLVPKILTRLKIAAGSFFRNPGGGVALGVVVALATVAPASARIHQLNSDETTLLQKITSTSAQRREAVRWDPILCKVARERAADMVRRHYFSHTSPSGKGANYLAREAGYVLPSYYDRSPSGNNIESIGMTIGTPSEMFSSWLKSKGHRTHLLGEVDFYRKQTSVGVGVVRSPDKPYYKYYVFLSAPPNASLNPRLTVLKNPKGVTLTTTRPLAGTLSSFLGSED